MASLKEVLEDLQKKIDKLSDSAREELEKKVKKEMEEEIFNLYIQTTIEWDNYLKSYKPKMYKWLFASRISQAQFHEYVINFNKAKTYYTNENYFDFLFAVCVRHPT